MTYKLRFIQKFKVSHTKEFLEIEKQFAQFEEKYSEFPKGTRYIPYSGLNSVNTLRWECDFDSMDELQKAHAFLMSDDRHEELFHEQAKYMEDAYTEIYRPYLS